MDWCSRIRHGLSCFGAEVRRDCSLLFSKLKDPWSLAVFAMWNIGIFGAQMGTGVLTFELSAATLRHEARRMIVFPLGLPQALGFAFSAKEGSYVLLGNFAAFCGLGFYHLLHWFTRFALLKSILVVGVGVLQTLEVFVCGYLVRRSLCSRVKKVPCIDSLKDAFYYFGIVLAVSIPFEAAVTLFQCLSSIVSWSDFLLYWGTWSMGVIAAMLTVSPVIIHAFVWRPQMTLFRLSKVVEVAVVGVVTGGLLVLVYTFSFRAYIKPLPYLLFPVIVHAGFRFNRVGWALVLCVISLFCTWATAESRGALYEISGARDVDPRLVVQMQLFVSVTAGVGVSLAAAVREKKHLARKLERLNEKLESLVHQKTHQLVRANDELKASQRAAELASKSKSEFLANMSHEIRTPIHGILGMATLILGTELTEEQRDSMNTLRECADLLLHIINSILDLAKIEAGRFDVEKADFNLHRIVKNTMLILGPRTKQRGLSLRLEIDKDVPEFVVGDSGKVQQCLLNLVGNALKFTHEGSVTVQLSLQESGSMADPVLSKIDTINWPEESEGITEISKTRNLYIPRHTNIPVVTSDAAPVHVLFKITDTGIGISKEKLQEIFKPFTQADASISRLYGGTGLGLSIVQRFVELIGGHILGDSEPGKGSTFYVFLPFHVKTPSLSIAEKADKGNSASASQARVVEIVQPPNTAAEGACASSVLNDKVSRRGKRAGVRIEEPTPAREPVQSAEEEHFFSFREDDTFHVLALQQIEESPPQEPLFLGVAETPTVGWTDEYSTQSRGPLLESADRYMTTNPTETHSQQGKDSSQVQQSSKAGPRPSLDVSETAKVGEEGSPGRSEAVELPIAAPLTPDKSEAAPDKFKAAIEESGLATGPSATIEAQTTAAAGALETATSAPEPAASGADKRTDVVIDVNMLQRSDRPALQRQAASTTATTNSGPSFRILLVEDNIINQKVAAKLLQKSGHTVTVVADGVQAVEAVQSNRDTIDLVLMDIQMPNMDGLEATRCIREEETKLKCRRRMPIVGLTAHAMQGYKETCLSAGMDGYLAKPFELNQVLATIKEIITRRDVRIKVKNG